MEPVSQIAYFNEASILDEDEDDDDDMSQSIRESLPRLRLPSRPAALDGIAAQLRSEFKIEHDSGVMPITLYLDLVPPSDTRTEEELQQEWATKLKQEGIEM